MAKRRSNSQICIDLKKSRKALYAKRNTLVRQQKKKKMTARQLSNSNSRIKNLTIRIDKYSSKIFKCGKKYAKFKKLRISLLKKISRIKVELKSNRDMENKLRNSKLTELNQLNEEVRNLSMLMQMDVIEQEKGQLAFIESYEEDETTELVVVWKAKNMIEDLMQMDFKFLTIKGETYSLEINSLSALWAIDDYIAEITAKQRESKFKTPMISVTISNMDKTIRVD
jgi:hypothetical protein